MSSPKQIIAVVSADFFHPKGGMGRSFQWIAESLSRDATVIVGTSSTSEKTHPYAIRTLCNLSRRFGGHLLFSFLLQWRLSHWLSKNHVTDLVVPVGPGGVFLLRVPRNVRLIACVYHTYAQQSRFVPGQWWKKIFVPFESWTLRRADSILCFNEDTQRVLMKEYRLPIKRIQLLPHAIDSSWAQSSASEKQQGLCVCVARLEKRKGVDVLLKAWSTVHAQNPGARLIIIGRGMQEKMIDEMITHMNGPVKRIPQVTFDELRQIVRSAELALCPAYLEGFGLAAAEAMTAGTAVIATDADGLRCLIEDGKTGWLFPMGDENALARSIVHALKDDHGRRTVAGAAKRFAAEQFDAAHASSVLRSAITRHGEDQPVAVG